MPQTTQPPDRVTKAPGRKLSYARIERDQLNLEAGRFLRRCTTLQKILAMATGQHPSWISRQIHGDPTGAVQRFYDLLASLATHRKTDPSPLIVGGLLQIGEAFGDLTDEDLYRRLREALEVETTKQAEEDLAEYRVLDCLARVRAKNATPADFEALHEALLEHEEKLIDEESASIRAILLGRELRRRKLS